MADSLRRLSWLFMAVSLSFVIGCGSGSEIETIPVRGSVKFDDGSIPTGEVATVHFEPVKSGNQKISKVASGQIAPTNGSFELTTVKPGDGAIAGTYKVIFEVHKTYLGRELVVADEYGNAATTPFEVVVDDNGASQTEFVLRKR